MASPSASANGYRRRKLIAQVKAEEDTCHICGKPVDKTLTWWWGHHGPRCKGNGCPGCVPHPDRPEVDELIPRSKGGDPLDRTNCRLAHRHCNRERGNGTRRPKPPPANPWPLSNAWGSTFAALTRLSRA